MNKKKVKELIEEAKHLAILRKYENRQTYLNNCICCLKEALEELSKSDWVSVEDGLPPVDKEVVVLTIVGRISFGHIVDKKIAKDYNGWNIPDVEYWLPFVDPKDE
jgi:hypothetical protein